MKTNALFYKIQKRTVTTKDYVNWSHNLLANDISSPSVNILSSISYNESIFEVEVYFKRALQELSIQAPTIETCTRDYLGYLAAKILEANSHSAIFDLAYMMYRIIASDLDYPDDLMEWYEVSELIDQLRYSVEPTELNEEEVISRIKIEASNYPVEQNVHTSQSTNKD